MSPIRPENLDRYPADWPRIRARILMRAGNRCERCGIPNGTLGGRCADGTFLDAEAKEERLLRRYGRSLASSGGAATASAASTCG